MTARFRQAYTLVEVVVTIGVLALITTFIVPTYQLILSQLQLNSTVEDVAAFIRQAEQQTVTQQQIYGVTFVAGASSIPMFLYNSVNGTKAITTSMAIPTNITISVVSFSGNSDVRFATSGAPNVAGNIVLKDTVRGRSREIDIRPSGAIINNTGEF